VTVHTQCLRTLSLPSPRIVDIIPSASAAQSRLRFLPLIQHTIMFDSMQAIKWSVLVAIAAVLHTSVVAMSAAVLRPDVSYGERIQLQRIALLSDVVCAVCCANHAHCVHEVHTCNKQSSSLSTQLLLLVLLLVSTIL
jgi:hypothetical protein